MQIFFSSQTSQFCVVLTHFIIDCFYDILSSQNTDQFSSFGQNWQRIFGVIFNRFDAVFNFFMICYIWIRSTDDVFQFIVFSGDDQILQINGAVKFIGIIYYVNCGNIVIFACLFYQFTHSLTDRQFFSDGNKVRCHHTSDFILIVGENQMDVMTGISIQQFYDFFFCGCFHLFQYIYRIIRIHVGYDFCSLIDTEL